MKTGRRQFLKAGLCGGAPLLALGATRGTAEPVGKDFAIEGFRLMARMPGMEVAVLTAEEVRRGVPFNKATTTVNFGDTDWEVWLVRVPERLKIRKPHWPNR